MISNSEEIRAVVVEAYELEIRRVRLMLTQYHYSDNALAAALLAGQIEYKPFGLDTTDD